MTRTALVTGTCRGIGAAVADRFESLGWTVYRMDRAAEESSGTIVGDVTSPDDWDRVSERIGVEVGRLDVLVNNAGILREAPLADATLDLWNDVINVNLTSAFLSSRAMLPLLEKGDHPTILNFSSIDGLRGSLWHSAYAASKGGILSLTRALALELADRGITVNAICPGTVDTPMVQNMLRDQAGISREALHPLKRISTPDDQAAAAAFLCGPEAHYITGVALSVDGGRAIR